MCHEDVVDEEEKDIVRYVTPLHSEVDWWTVRCAQTTTMRSRELSTLYWS